MKGYVDLMSVMFVNSLNSQVQRLHKVWHPKIEVAS